MSLNLTNTVMVWNTEKHWNSPLLTQKAKYSVACGCDVTKFLTNAPSKLCMLFWSAWSSFQNKLIIFVIGIDSIDLYWKQNVPLITVWVIRLSYYSWFGLPKCIEKIPCQVVYIVKITHGFGINRDFSYCLLLLWSQMQQLKWDDAAYDFLSSCIACTMPEI